MWTEDRRRGAKVPGPRINHQGRQDRASRPEGGERAGEWGGPTNKNPPKGWAIYPDIKGPEHAASDHAAICVDINI